MAVVRLNNDRYFVTAKEYKYGTLHDDQTPTILCRGGYHLDDECDWIIDDHAFDLLEAWHNLNPDHKLWIELIPSFESAFDV